MRSLRAERARLAATSSPARSTGPRRLVGKRRIQGQVRAATQDATDAQHKLEAKLESVRDKVIVIDNYDSFTFNLCQVSALKFSA